MRKWPIWLSLILLAITVGWFWLVSRQLQFTRTEQEVPRPAAEAKGDAKK